MFNSEIIIEGNKEFLKACVTAIEPETEFKTDRASYDIALDKKLIIKVKAEDATAFRAVMTSLTGLLQIVEKAWNQKAFNSGK